MNVKTITTSLAARHTGEPYQLLTLFHLGQMIQTSSIIISFARSSTILILCSDSTFFAAATTCACKMMVKKSSHPFMFTSGSKAAEQFNRTLNWARVPFSDVDDFLKKCFQMAYKINYMLL